MPPLVLDSLPRPLQSALRSAGYRAARWAAAREVLHNRLVKQRVHGLLGEALARWGVAGAGTARPEGLHLTFGLMADRLWMCDGPAAEPLERVLLHLPALRSFWRQELRQTHFDALKAVVPRAWVREETVLPPGAVIHSLNLASWEELPKLGGRQPPVVAEGGFYTEQPTSHTRINASYHRDDKRRVVLKSVEALS